MSASHMPPSPPRVVACPACGQRLGVRAEDLGRRGKCRRCGEVFRIGEAPPDSPALPNEPAKPATVSFSCELCETRLTARVADVGKTLKCPDCGRRNVIPPPTPLRAPKKPPAMTGDQYGLWEIDQAPLPEELVAKAPRLHPVECGLCQTLMYATDSQLGTKLKCPDCGTLTVAQPRAPARPQGSVLVPDGEEYQLDEASAPTPRPVSVPIDMRIAELRDAETRSGAGSATRSGAASAEGPSPEPEGPRRRRLGEAPREERPERPAVPLVQGVLPMLLTVEILARWVVLSLFLTGILWMLSSIVTMDMSGFRAFYILKLFAGGCILGGLWLTAALPLFISIVVESSEGNDRLQDPPQWTSFDWFGELGFFAISASMSALPAWLTTKLTTELPLEGQVAIAVGVWLLCFPIALLSGLEQSSPFAVISPRLVASLLRCAGPWLLFYLQSVVIGAAIGLATWKVLTANPALAFLLPWLAVGGLLIYMRLLGRLAWWIAETMPAPEEAEKE